MHMHYFFKKKEKKLKALADLGFKVTPYIHNHVLN